MQLFDICVNLADRSFAKDRDAVLRRAYNAGVRHMLLPGSDLENSKRNIELAARYSGAAGSGPMLYTAVGYHPHQAKLWHDKSRAQLVELAQSHQGLVRAIGECGLDYNRNFSEPAQQRRAFIEQLELAAELQLPVFLHEREAHEDFFSILSEHRQNLTKVLVHCFTGAGEHLEKYLQLDCYIGITGWFCDERRGAHLHKLVPKLPTDRLLLETDAPYLLPRDLLAASRNKNRTLHDRAAISNSETPVANGAKDGKNRNRHNRRNEPSNLPHILSALANCLGQPPEQLAARTLANSMAYLGIDE